VTKSVLSVSPDVFDRFPSYIVGWVTATVSSDSLDTDAIENLLRESEARVRLLYADKDLKEETAIAGWRRAFSSLGWSASRFPSSVEALVKRVAKGASLPLINPLVNLANAAALTYLVPVGCHDVDRSPALRVRFAETTDQFLPMGGDDAEHPESGEIVYASLDHVRTRRWVWRQSRDALVDADTTNVVIPVDGFSDTTVARVDAATNFIAATISGSGGQKVRWGLIDRDRQEIPELSSTN
jgi:DNA/RNA-binding domain of Phe-tRNA-synthetase-like protein